MNAIEKSKCIIEAVLEKIAQDYPMTEGAGIAGVRFVSTYTVEAVMPQEERADVWTFTYEMATDGTVTFTEIKKTTE